MNPTIALLNMSITRLHVLSALVACTLPLFTGCAESRHQALERRQNGFDARADARGDRRELRSDRADARYDRSFDHW
jgi:hypothetical protein